MLLIEDVPSDLLSRVFTWLDFSDLRTLLCVSHRFRSAASMSFLWTDLSWKTWAEMQGTAELAYGQQIERALVCKGSGLVAVEITEAGSLASDHTMELLAKHASQLQRLSFGCTNTVSDVGLGRVLASCAQLREISILQTEPQAGLTEGALALMGDHCAQLETLLLIGFSTWFSHSSQKLPDKPRGVGPLRRLLAGCPQLQELTLTKTVNRRWNDVCPYAVEAIREAAATRPLRVELCSHTRPVPLDISCGMCGSTFYEKLSSYLHVPGNQRHITSEVCTDTVPILGSFKRGGTPADSDGDGHTRLRCCNICQPIWYWLIDNGTPQVNRFGYAHSAACGLPRGGPTLARQTPNLLGAAWAMMDPRWAAGVHSWADYEQQPPGHIFAEGGFDSSDEDEYASGEEQVEYEIDLAELETMQAHGVPFVHVLQQQPYSTSEEDSSEEEV